MGSRLPPGEAERRKRERAKATWSGANYKRYDPEKEGYGNRTEWAGQAKSFVNGDVQVVTPIDEDLTILGLTESPENMRALSVARRRAAAALHSRLGSDTAPGYKEGFEAITAAFDRVKRSRGW